MNTKVIVTPCWSTASFGDSAETSPMEMSALGEHLSLCQDARGPLFALQSLAGTMNGFVAGRFVTTLVVAALIIGVGSLVL